ALEHLCHLRDLEREGYAERIRRLLVETDPFLPDVDGDRLAKERDYNRQDFARAHAGFAGARAANVAALNVLSPEQLGRAGTLEGVGPVTLGRLLELMRDHDDAHRRELRDLGRRLDEGIGAGHDG
ncbi:MAG: DinB family protein, partial [Pyrinomonadaceae bacterium]